MNRTTVTLVSILVFTGVAFAAMYKWVDEEGNVHYTDCPPPEKKCEEIETAPPPAEEDVQRARERTERLIEEQKHREKARKLEREQKQKEAQMRAEELKKRCKILRSRLYLLTQPGVITITDAEGNIVRPTDEQRARMIKEIDSFIRENCK